MNQTRYQQVISTIKRLVSSILRDSNHELFHDVVVTGAILSNDGAKCEIFVQSSPRMIQQLNEIHHHAIQRQFRRVFNRKVVPQLSFRPDQGDDQVIESLLSQARQKS